MNADKHQERNRLYEFGEFRLDPPERVLERRGRRIPLSPRAFDTLVVLVESSGHVLTKDELIGKIWPDTFVEENNLTQQISALRRALGASVDSAGKEYIETIPRLGYRFIAEVREVNGEAAGSEGLP